MVNVVVYFHSFHPFVFSNYPDRTSHWVRPAGFEYFEMLQYAADLIRIDIFGGYLHSTAFDILCSFSSLLTVDGGKFIFL